MSLLSKTAKLALEAGTDSGLGTALVPVLRQAREFTKQEWETHLKKHPKADKSKHTITDGGGSGEDKPKGKGKSKEEPKPKGKGKSKGEVEEEVAKKKIKLDVPAEVVAEFSGEIPDYHLEIIAGGEGGEITEADLRRAKAIKVQMQRGIQAAADVCEMSPPVCADNLGVYRESMPQLSADEPIKTMLMSDEERIKDNGGGGGFPSPSKGWKKVPFDQLSDDEQAGQQKDWATARKKGQAAVDAGADPKDDRTVFKQLLDGLAKEGTKIGSQEPPFEKVEVGKLKATQREIKAGKTFGMANSYLSGQYDPRKSPIIISSDNHILDGHHRYAAMITADPEASMNVIRVDMKMKDFLERSFDQPGVFRADLQDNIVDSDKPLDLARAKGSTWQQKGKWYAKNNDGESSGPFKNEKGAKGYIEGKKEKGKKASSGGHHHKGTDGKWYADTAFLNAASRVPRVSLEHMGFGEFYADTPKGRVDFDRMRGRDFEGQSGRSHQVYGEGAEWLIAQMDRGNHSERVATVHPALGTSLRTATIWLAAENLGSFSEALLPIINASVRTSSEGPLVERAVMLLIRGPMTMAALLSKLDRHKGSMSSGDLFFLIDRHKRFKVTGFNPTMVDLAF